MKKFLTFLFLLSFTLLTGADLDIVAKGNSPYAIVYADRTPLESLTIYNATAAETLQKLIRHSTGVSLPVVKESLFKHNRKGIFIGNTEAARKAGLTPAKWEIWEHRIDVKNGNIYLHGMDFRNRNSITSRFRTYFVLGSYKATMTFLEKFAGAVFAGTPEITDAIPKKAVISIPEEFHFRHVPRIRYTTTGAGRRSLEYDVANNAFFSPLYGSYGGHNHPVAVPAKKYFKSNPEFFSLRKGKRDPGSQNQLCLANKKVQELIYQEVLDHLDKGYEMVQLAQSDGFIPCECQPCRDLFGIKVTASPSDFAAHRQDPAWGEKLWILHKGFAERLLKDRPGKKVCIIAYGPTRQPPRTFKNFPANVTIELAPFSEEIVNSWKSYSVPGGFTVYLYNWGFYKLEGFMPKMNWDSCKAQVKLFHKTNVKGIYCCGFGELHGLEGPTYYIWLKLLQEPDLDVKQLLKRFCDQTFGASSADMENFYTLLDERLKLKFTNKETDWNDPALLNGTMPASRINIGTINLRWPDKVLEKLDSILGAAEKKSPGNWQLKLVRTEFDFMKYTARAVNQFSKFRRTLAKADYLAFQELALKRVECIENFTYDKKGSFALIDGMPLFAYAKKSQIYDGGRLSAPLHAPFNWDLKWLKAHNVIPAGRSIKTDGKAHYLVPINYLSPMTAPYMVNNTRILCKRDEKALYVYFIVANADYQKMRNIGISVFLGPDQKNLKRFAGRFRSGSTSQYVFVKNNAENKGQGNVMKLQGTGVKITVPAPGIKTGKDEIVARITIPWSKFGKTPAPGDKWLFNALSDFTDPKSGRVCAIWEHNFDQATWRNTLDRQGQIEL